MMLFRRLLPLHLVLLALAPTLVLANDDRFAGATGQTIAGNVLTNDGTINAPPELASEPRNGQLLNGLEADGTFDYLPNTGFEGIDQFVYTVVADGREQVFAVRLSSGSVQLVPANRRDEALGVLSGAKRTPVELVDRSDTSASAWQFEPSAEAWTVSSSAASNRVLETWQPSATGTEPTIYSRNSRPWQRFEFETSRGGALILRSSFTGFRIAIEGTDVVARQQTGSSNEFFLEAGPGQTLPPTVADDRFFGAPDALIAGDVLLNDASNSADIASFLVTRPSNGEFVGINQVIYDGLAPFGNFEYQPNPGFEGVDTFTYFALGSSTGSPSRLVTVSLRVGDGGNDPFAGDDLFFTSTDTTITRRVLSNDENLTGGFFDPAAALVDGPRFGELGGIGALIYEGITPWGEFEYTPDPGFVGVDSIAYRIFNSGEPSNVATVFLVVGDVQLAPLSNWRNVLGAPGTANRTHLEIQSNDPGPLQIFNFQQTPTGNAQYIRFNGKAVETWQPQAAGLDATVYQFNALPWQVFEPELSASGALVIRSAYTGRELAAYSGDPGASVGTVPPLDDPNQRWLVAGPAQSFAPTGVDDAVSTTVGTDVGGNVLLNDQPNGFDFAAFLVEAPSNGELVGIGGLIYDGIAPWGQFDYRPDPGFTGQDQFVYQVLTSGNGAPSRYVTVTIDVLP